MISTYYKTHNITPPCKDCQDRHSGCHSKCKKYKAFFDANEKRKEMLQKKRRLDAVFYNGKRDRHLY